MMEWRICFYMGKQDVEKLMEFLRVRLDPAYSLKARYGEVIVGNCRDKDEAWRVALWIRHNCGLRPRFVIEGREEGKVIWLSSCKLCREGKAHEHSR